jgi:2-polyprenyl-6-methoxyphenol hydroxylase-like FAD-dependent oxidoreductase
MSQVLIAGAGIGGLCLAQGLRKAGIAFHVYERDDASHYRLQGYRIRIHSNGLEALRKCLPVDVYDLFEQTCGKSKGGAPVQVDPITGEVRQAQGMPNRGPMGGESRAVDRRVLRDVLLSGLENHISYGKEVVKFSTEKSESVTVWFKDGTSASGTLLVGADGVQSCVRKTYLPNYRPVDTGGRIIFGKTPLTNEIENTVPAGMLRSMSIVRDAESPIKTVNLFESMVFASPDSRPPYPNLPADYVYWVICLKSDDLSTLLSPEESHGRITTGAAVAASQKVAAHWHPSLRKLFELQDNSQTSVLPIYTHLPPMPVWESVPTVTLIGDAAHAMPPTGASGCVTALRDAATLLDMIKEKGTRDGVAAYEAAMREYAGSIIELSINAAIGSFGFKPREQWRQSDE